MPGILNTKQRRQRQRAMAQQIISLILLQSITFTMASLSLSAQPHPTSGTEGKMRRMIYFSSGPNTARWIRDKQSICIQRRVNHWKSSSWGGASISMRSLYPGQNQEVIGSPEETGKGSTKYLAPHQPQDAPAQKVVGCQVTHADSFSVAESKHSSLQSCSAVTSVHGEACCVNAHTPSYLCCSRGTSCPPADRDEMLSGA